MLWVSTCQSSAEVSEVSGVVNNLLPCLYKLSQWLPTWQMNSSQYQSIKCNSHTTALQLYSHWEIVWNHTIVTGLKVRPRVYQLLVCLICHQPTVMCSLSTWKYTIVYFAIHQQLLLLPIMNSNKWNAKTIPTTLMATAVLSLSVWLALHHHTNTSLE